MQKISVYYRKSLHTNCMLNKDMVCDYVSPTDGRDIGTTYIYTHAQLVFVLHTLKKGIQFFLISLLLFWEKGMLFVFVF